MKPVLIAISIGLCVIPVGTATAKPGARLAGYRCRSDDGHIYSLTRAGHQAYRLYIQESERSPDRSDIVYDGKAIISLETNGGVGKQAEVTKLFTLIHRQRLSPTKTSEAAFLTSRPSARCPFRYVYNLS